MAIDKKTWWAFGITTATLLQLGGAGAVWFLRGEEAQRLAGEQARAVTLAKDLEAQQARLAQPTREPEPAPAAENASSRWRLLDGPDVATTLEVVNALGVEMHLTFDVIKAATSNVVGKQTFQLAGHGTPPQVCEFLAAIENHQRLIVVESGRVMPGDGETISFEFGLATYHRGGAR